MTSSPLRKQWLYFPMFTILVLAGEKDRVLFNEHTGNWISGLRPSDGLWVSDRCIRGVLRRLDKKGRVAQPEDPWKLELTPELLAEIASDPIFSKGFQSTRDRIANLYLARFEDKAANLQTAMVYADAIVDEMDVVYAKGKKKGAA